MSKSLPPHKPLPSNTDPIPSADPIPQPKILPSDRWKFMDLARHWIFDGACRLNKANGIPGFTVNTRNQFGDDGHQTMSHPFILMPCGCVVLVQGLTLERELIYETRPAQSCTLHRKADPEQPDQLQLF